MRREYSLLADATRPDQNEIFALFKLFASEEISWDSANRNNKMFLHTKKTNASFYSMIHGSL